MSETILEPGRSIKALITENKVRESLLSLYGIQTKTLNEMIGYDDRNFYIETESDEKFVFKVVNSMDSKDIDFVECQNTVLTSLATSKVKTPKPIANKFGSYYSVIELNSQKHVVRLLSYLEGKLLKEVKRVDRIAFEVGKMAGKFDLYFEKEVNLPGLDVLKRRKHAWMLKSIPDLDKFKFVIKDAERMKLVDEVIEEFKSDVLPLVDELPRGVIHGDLTETNILVQDNGDSDYSIVGLLDFGDIQYSCFVFEVAIAMTYIILLSGDIDDGYHVLKGYNKERMLTRKEASLLKACICARLVQSLVLGAYSIKQDPKNTYVLSTAKADGWGILKKLRNFDDGVWL